MDMRRHSTCRRVPKCNLGVGSNPTRRSNKTNLANNFGIQVNDNIFEQLKIRVMAKRDALIVKALEDYDRKHRPFYFFLYRIGRMLGIIRYDFDSILKGKK